MIANILKKEGLIREIKPQDAENFINLIKQVETEAKFMLMEAGERTTTPEQQRIKIEQMKLQSNSTILIAEKEEGKLAGYLIAIKYLFILSIP